MAAPTRLVLFDGDCGLCDRSVRWFVQRDPGRRFHFAPLQGDTARQVRERHPDLQFPDSIVLIDGSTGDERVYFQSRAVFQICAELSGGWRALAWLRIIPAPLTDLGYSIVARLRHRLFRPPDVCNIATIDRARFLP